jgi:hypothetical protein
MKAFYNIFTRQMKMKWDVENNSKKIASYHMPLSRKGAVIALK